MTGLTVDEANEKVHEILRRIDGSLSDTQLADVNDALLAVKRVLPFRPQFRPVRRIIKETIREIADGVTQRELENIESRTEQLSEVVETIAGISSETNEAAEQLRLAHIKGIIDTTNEAMEALQTIRTDLAGDNLQGASEKIEAAIRKMLAIQRRATAANE